jgi:hypothetical protein
MLTCEIRAKKVYYPADSLRGCYCSLVLPTHESWEPQEAVTKAADGQLYICPKALIAWFRENVCEVVRAERDRNSLLKKHKVGKPSF